MNNRQARIFAIACTGIATLVFLGLTIDSHRQFPELTQSKNITEEVSSGMDVWHKYNCINCHTLFGEGAYYAPDLTKITKQRGDAYLKAYMRDPSQFYDEQKHRRLMPDQGLSEQEISDLLEFLEWVSNVDNQGWPPRPIRVTGGPAPNAVPFDGAPAAEAPGNNETTRPVSEKDDLRAQGQKVFNTAQPACTSCHSTAPGADMAGPTLAGLAGKAKDIVDSPDYEGNATDAEGYIRESIVAPSAHLVPGGQYSAGGTSFMPATYGESLSEKELNQLVAYLKTLK